MPEEKDLLAMLEILTTAIEIHSNEENFFRRSSTASGNDAAKSLLLEIATEIGQYREKLEVKRQNLREELERVEDAAKKFPKFKNK